jgi:hypothetical protein
MSNRVNHRRDPEHQRRVLDTRRSNATSKHKSVKDYRRKPKHQGKGWAE